MSTPRNNSATIKMGANFSPNPELENHLRNAVQKIIDDQPHEISNAWVSAKEDGSFDALLHHKQHLNTTAVSFKFDEDGEVGTFGLVARNYAQDNNITKSPINADNYDVFIGSPISSSNGNAQNIFDDVQEMICSILNSFKESNLELNVLAVFDQPTGYSFSTNSSNITIDAHPAKDCVADLYHKLLLSNRLKAFIHIGHGSPDFLALTGNECLSHKWFSSPKLLTGVTKKTYTVPNPVDFKKTENISITTPVWGEVQPLDLSKMVIVWNSCLVANNPMKDALLQHGHPRTFIGGITELSIIADPNNNISKFTGGTKQLGSSEVVAKFWDAILKNPSDKMIDAFVAAYNAEYEATEVRWNPQDQGTKVSFVKAMDSNSDDEIAVDRPATLLKENTIGVFGYYGYEGPIML